jgi:hypothetical protein
MFRNHKGLVDFGEFKKLFGESDSFDNNVSNSLRQIAKFHFDIKTLKYFDKLFLNLDKIV